jgi:F-type H+-transporting ATPase subunit epsilon
MPAFHCEILTPYRRFFAGEIESLVLEAFDGQVEILAGHESMVTAVHIGIARIRTAGQMKRAAVTEGFIRVKAGRVDVFVDAAEWPEEIEMERAERALGRAMKRIAAETHAWQLAASRLAAARAHNRIAAAGGAAGRKD